MMATRPRPGSVRAIWDSSIGKKAVMAVTGLIMLLFLIAHMLGNLKIFYGASEFDSYSGWIRRIGEPVFHNSWYLWIQRFVLVVAVLLHITAAAQLSKRDIAARSKRYAHGLRPRASFATRTMRWGGVILALFIVWHILDLTVGTVNPDYVDKAPYHNVVADFQTWWVNVIYFVAMIMLGLHINHGFWSAAQTLGYNSPKRDVALKATGSVLAVLLTAGFLIVPIAVMTGLVS